MVARVLGRVSGGALIWLLAACGDATSPPPVSPIELPLTNKIVFQSDRVDSLGDVWLMEPDGSGVRALTDTTTRDRCASVSPDGNWIALYQLSAAAVKAPIVNWPPVQDSIVVMRADGTERAAVGQLERYAGFDTVCPQWAATSDRFLTASAIDEARTRIDLGTRVRVMERSGNVLTAVIFASLGDVAISPSGTHLLASTYRVVAGPPIDRQVTSMRIDGTERRSVGEGFGAVWSPTGGLIAWACPAGVCVSDPSGGNASTLYSSTSWLTPRAMQFSPDGKYLAFLCQLSLCFADVATGAVEVIPAPGASRIRWLPGSTSVVFECALVGAITDICRAERGSGTFTNLTKHPSNDREPSAR